MHIHFRYFLILQLRKCLSRLKIRRVTKPVLKSLLPTQDLIGSHHLMQKSLPHMLLLQGDSPNIHNDVLLWQQGLILGPYLPQQLFIKPYHRSDKTVGIHVIPLEIGRNVVQVLGYTNSNQLVASLRIEASDRILVAKKVLGEDSPKSPPFLCFFGFFRLSSLEYCISQGLLTLELDCQQINSLFGVALIQGLKSISFMLKRCNSRIHNCSQYLCHSISLIFYCYNKTLKRLSNKRMRATQFFEYSKNITCFGFPSLTLA